MLVVDVEALGAAGRGFGEFRCLNGGVGISGGIFLGTSIAVGAGGLGCGGAERGLGRLGNFAISFGVSRFPAMADPFCFAAGRSGSGRRGYRFTRGRRTVEIFHVGLSAISTRVG